MVKFTVIGQNIAKLARFKSSWQNVNLEIGKSNTLVPVRLETHLWEELGTLIDRDNLLLVNCTPIGMYPDLENSPISAETIGEIGADSIAYDLIYTPRPTKFLQLAKDAGIITIDGTEMLVQQGGVAFELWLQQPAPIEIMRHALIQRLN